MQSEAEAEAEAIEQQMSRRSVWEKLSGISRV